MEYIIERGKNGEYYAYDQEGNFVQSADTLDELEHDLAE